MTSQFPGINPHLENSELWTDFHKKLIRAIARVIRENLHPRYRVEISKSGSIEIFCQVGLPPVRASVAEPVAEMIQTWGLNINSYYEATPEEEDRIYKPALRRVVTGEIVTVIEILSQENKCSSEVRKAYEKNRQRILNSLTNLVEIDLLRDCEPMPTLDKQVNSDYRILVNRALTPREEKVYSFGVQDKIPAFSLPLLPDDKELLVDLQVIVHEVYKDLGFDIDSGE